ncbi:bacterial nucleoid protein Hbs [Thermanaeromonas toyohensis ToBE]|uniref:Bacterial nucleoid protein Hbs n=1 Tax=Thermanaeromonas toyohensis ToBE TaxID=698762 RepID=A0A1W1VS93_9FIRM|nr:HU family DNA-binding protein [Thermanaeromonas toyohensis]SMB96227.1 bacterial nucleoid protein Hbs [Thermanaeromonas toyohensis ToBE]
MTKAELVKAVAEKAGMSQKDAGRALDAVLEAVREAVARGEDVRLPGFGAFVVRERAARKGRDLRTGKEITIPPAKVVTFRVGKLLKAAVVK